MYMVLYVAAERDVLHRVEAGMNHDAVGEDEPVPLRRELPWDEPVACEEEGEAREVGERRVRGQQEDQRRPRLGQVVERARPEDVARQLRDHGLLRARADPEVIR